MAGSLFKEGIMSTIREKDDGAKVMANDFSEAEGKGGSGIMDGEVGGGMNANHGTIV